MKMMIQKSHCIFCKSTWFFDNIVQPFVWPKLGPKVTIQACLKFLTLQMLLYSFQNFDTEEPRLSPIVSVNCNSEQFCGDHYLTHTKSNQACQIEAAGFPASLVSLCVGLPSLPFNSTASFSTAPSAVITTQSICWKTCTQPCGTTQGILISICGETHSFKLILVLGVIDRGGSGS